jgi:ankyrin repeat protein
MDRFMSDQTLQSSHGALIDHLDFKAAAAGQIQTDINSQDDGGNAALYYAASCGYLDLVQSLLERGADFHLKNNAGSTPLHIAASAGHVEVCLGLLERGADVNLSNKLDQTPLYNATFGCYLDLAQILLDRGADINHKNMDRDTLLHIAAFAGQAELCEFLLDRGADMNVKNQTGNYAAFPRYLEAVDFRPIRGGLELYQILFFGPRCRHLFDEQSRKYAIAHCGRSWPCRVVHIFVGPWSRHSHPTQPKKQSTFVL